MENISQTEEKQIIEGEAAVAEAAAAVQTDENMKEKKPTFMSGVMDFLKDLVVAVIIAVVVLQFIKPTIVKESSMEATLWENDYLLLSKQSYKLFKGEPQRGDIIVFHTNLTTADGQEKLLIKRVVGLPGETITITNGQVFIDGDLLEEDYIKNPLVGTSGEIYDLTIPEGQIFAMGDNREVSKDSRSSDVGCIDIDKIVGKAFVRLFPFNSIRTF